MADHRDIEIISVAEFNVDDVEETGTSFEENALLKAETIARATGLPALADDSGLCVDALDGAPGIYSARWSGTHGDDGANIEKLLTQLEAVEDRAARFVCVIALAAPDGRHLLIRGELEGNIRRHRAGSNGFGYDPIFEPIGMDITLAEVSPEKKDEISHRGKALRAIAPEIAPFLNSL
jgi:XTP/dITP diphosphohydrolase